MEIPSILFDMKSAFAQYALTGDDNFIERYNLDQLKQAASFITTLEKEMPYAKAIFSRIDDLKASTSQKRTAKEKWIDRIVSFVSGIIASIAFLWIRKLITGSW